MRDKLLSAGIFLTFILISCSQAYSDTTNTDTSKNIEKEKIWSLEEAYFTNLYEANYEEVLAVVHSQFLGWPHALPQPIDKEGSAYFMKKSFPKPTLYNLNIEREGIRVLDNVALTEYTLKVNYTDSGGVEKIQSSRIAHTWTQENSQWKLLGGMSYAEQGVLQSKKEEVARTSDSPKRLHSMIDSQFVTKYRRAIVQQSR